MWLGERGLLREVATPALGLGSLSMDAVAGGTAHLLAAVAGHDPAVLGGELGVARETPFVHLGWSQLAWIPDELGVS